MIKALFFDIDGTLVSFNTHEIPVSTVEALEAAKAAGVKIFISTGRPVALINNLGAISHLIDGYLTSNGAYCYIGDSVVYDRMISEHDVRALAEASDAGNWMYIVVGIRDLLVRNPDRNVVDTFKKMLNVSDLPTDIPMEEMLRQGIVQMTVFVTAEEERQVMKNTEKCVSSRWYPAFTDITAEGADKGSAVEAIARRLGIDISETMAFGDGGNDVPMLRRAGIGVAMGNATDDVQQEADYVTTSVDDNGVSNALRKFGVI